MTAWFSFSAEQKVLIAYSGGCDSTALLYLCHEKFMRGELGGVRAVHVNHHLSPHANAWQQHCEQVCQSLSIPLVSCDVYLTEDHNIEAQARQLRYAAIEKMIDADELLLTAHQQNDQAETVLLQLARGAGVQGLPAMPEVSAFANTQHVRPLLKITRADLENYLQQKNITWINDDSNVNARFQRNFLREHVLPVWQQQVPALIENIARSSQHCAEALSLLDDFAESLLEQCITMDQSLSVKKLLTLSRAQQALVLRYFIQAQGFALPSTVKLKDVLQQLQAKEDAKVCVAWEGCELRRYADCLWALSPLPDDYMVLVDVHEGEPYMRCFGKCYFIVPTGPDKKFRQGGEKLHILQTGRHRDLKKCLQEWRVPPWLRDRLPLVYRQEQCVGAEGFINESNT